LAGQEDKERCSWSAEHDASYLSNTLFYLIAQQKCVADIFVPGFAESILVYSLEGSIRSWNSWSPEIRQQYVIWRNSFGLTAPNAAVSEDPRLTSKFEGVVGMHQCQFTPDAAQAAFNLMFDKRTGDVYSPANRERFAASALPPMLALPSDRLARLAAPLDAAHWRALVHDLTVHLHAHAKR